ncbi:MAG: substrate-binding domain-containing protein [Butyrivibrio sp.]|uniref:sugar ABC transporter substrate-binding protein n=1 Tax=Butyrivibrio sp. TaxID=28121 RepID=UPI0025C04BD0|nr:substrate-binding domain-containing protein [Butyrivibrio sp.]MBQ6589194.1 substrate-binding domain-containing protein [Butyrivibrio sp.]
MGKRRFYILRVITSLLIAAFLCTCSGCSAPAMETDSSNKEKTDKIQIGMCFDSFVIERWQRDRDVFVSTAKELGAEVNVQNANGDPLKQKEQIEYFIKKGMDIIVIISIDPEKIVDSVKKAQDEGIKVIAYDRPITNAGADLYISFDNEMVGEMMGEAFVKSGLKGGKVVMICGPLTDNNVPMVRDGFTRVMEENDNEVLDIYYADGWKAEAAGDYVYSNTELIEEADAIMCGNDDLASRVVYALSEKRLAGKKLVSGQDADLEACQRIVEGTQLMTVYKPIEKLARTAAEAAVAMVSGEELPVDDIDEYDDGKKIVPYLKIETVSVSADNMDEVIIKSGFHLEEDVYLNVPGK